MAQNCTFPVQPNKEELTAKEEPMHAAFRPDIQRVHLNIGAYFSGQLLAFHTFMRVTCLSNRSDLRFGSVGHFFDETRELDQFPLLPLGEALLLSLKVAKTDPSLNVFAGFALANVNNRRGIYLPVVNFEVFEFSLCQFAPRRSSECLALG